MVKSRLLALFYSLKEIFLGDVGKMSTFGINRLG